MTFTLIDGGLATALEDDGHDLSGGLWSARLLLDDTTAVEAVHRAFFEAGATVATTASYQASTLSFQRSGYDPELAGTAIRRSVEAARNAREQACPTGLVAGSLGAYGASLADGSEYTGRYGLDAGTAVKELTDFHRRRADDLLAAGVDVLACETIPSAAEIEALATLLPTLDVPAWVSLTPAPGGLTTRDGVPLADAVVPLEGVGNLVAVGVNCCAPDDVTPALAAILGRLPTMAGIAYPNSGETWDASAQLWRGEPHWSTAHSYDWISVGAEYLGGCCRVKPAQIAQLAALR